MLTIAVVALMGHVSCEKDPDAESGNIEIYDKTLEAKPEGEYSCLLYTIFNYVDGLEDETMYSDDVLFETLYEKGAYWTLTYFRGEWQFGIATIGR
ncbi:MAG: hypothetical protein IKB15_01930 [Alistipes sp.]|nr:hypothetical protein [Alistipes sp.]